MKKRSEELILPEDVCLQIAQHWGSFFLKKKHGSLHEGFLELSQPDVEIDTLMKDEGVIPPALKKQEEFYFRFRLVCKLAKLLINRSSKRKLERRYKTIANKMDRLLTSVHTELGHCTREELTYFSEIVQKSSDYMLEGAGDEKIEGLFPTFMDRLIIILGVFNMNKEVARNLEWAGGRSSAQKKRILSAWEGGAEHALKEFSGGHGKAKSRKAALCAVAESFLACFGEMPTCSENSSFMRYGKILYQYLGAGKNFDENLFRDAKAAVLKTNKSFKISNL